MLEGGKEKEKNKKHKEFQPFWARLFNTTKLKVADENSELSRDELIDVVTRLEQRKSYYKEACNEMSKIPLGEGVEPAILTEVPQTKTRKRLGDYEGYRRAVKIYAFVDRIRRCDLNINPSPESAKFVTSEQSKKSKKEKIKLAENLQFDIADITELELMRLMENFENAGKVIGKELERRQLYKSKLDFMI